MQLFEYPYTGKITSVVQFIHRKINFRIFTLFFTSCLWKELDEMCSFVADDEITPPANPLAILEKLWIVFGEYFGTTLLVYIACMGCTGMQSELSQLTTSLNAGLAVMAVIHVR